MVRKKILSRAFVIFFLFVLLVVPFSACPLGAAATPDHIVLTWASDPRTTQTISWRTSLTLIVGQVQYAESIATDGSFPSDARMVTTGMEKLSTAVGEMSIHAVTLTGLKPGTRYLYRVGDGLDWSPPHAFVTSAAIVPGFKFLVFGDSQSSNYQVWRTTLCQAYQANPDAVFLTNVGDLVDVGQDYRQWNAWFDAAQGVVDTIPVMPVTGNHETYTSDGRFSLPSFFTAQFKLPRNGPGGLEGHVYSFDYGDVHFIMLDSQAGEERQFLPDMLDRQKAWLAKDLRATKKKWKIAVFHRPPYSNREAGANNNVRVAFTPLFDDYHVDVVLNGHEHVYARTYPIHGGAVVNSPAQGTIYVTAGRSGTKTYQDPAANEWDSFFYPPLEEPNYVTVEVRGDRLTVKAVQQSGTVIDSWTIDKAADELH